MNHTHIRGCFQEWCAAHRESMGDLPSNPVDTYAAEVDHCRSKTLQSPCSMQAVHSAITTLGTGDGLDGAVIYWAQVVCATIFSK